MEKRYFTGIVTLLFVMFPLIAMGSGANSGTSSVNALQSASISSYDFILEEKPLSIYPNPASDNLTIQFESESNILPDVRILDLTGKEVLKIDRQMLYEDSVYRTTVDITSLKAGIYFVKVVQSKKVFTLKLMVE